jgi:BMFP domain-containing protein YqiC
MNDPRTADAINRAISEVSGEVPQRQEQPPRSDPNSQYVTREEFEQQQKVLARVATAYAETKLGEMRNKYSDFQSLEQDMLPIHKSNPNLSLEQLYHLVKIQKGGGTAVPRRPSAPPPTEVGPGGGGSRTGQVADPVARAQEQIRNLPPGPQQTEQALKIAYNAALESQGSE